MSISHEEMQRLLSSGEELQEILRKGREFTQQVVQENERLRYRIVQLEGQLQEAEAGRDRQLLGALQLESERLKEKVAFLEKRFAEVQRENEDFAQKYVEVAQQNEGLANLYVASFQLHSTLDPDEVIGIVKEIIINLVGSEEFVIFVADKRTREVSPVTWEGPFALGDGEPAPWDPALLDRVARTGQPFFAQPPEAGAAADLLPPDARPAVPLACVPLTIQQDVVGAIAVFKLLAHKPALAPLDMEILNLLAGHAATAIVSSRLYADAERKLKTIEGFIELLKAR